MTATTENKYAFPLQAAVEPHDLYGFHKDYLNQLPELRASIANKTGKFSEIFVKRLKPDGTVKQKVFKGTVKNHVSNGSILKPMKRGLDCMTNHKLCFSGMTIFWPICQYCLLIPISIHFPKNPMSKNTCFG